MPRAALPSIVMMRAPMTPKKARPWYRRRLQHHCCYRRRSRRQCGSNTRPMRSPRTPEQEAKSFVGALTPNNTVTRGTRSTPQPQHLHFPLLFLFYPTFLSSWTACTACHFGSLGPWRLTAQFALPRPPRREENPKKPLRDADGPSKRPRAPRFSRDTRDHSRRFGSSVWVRAQPPFKPGADGRRP